MSLSNKFILDDMEHKEDKFISSLEQLKSESSDVENSLECRILFGGYACSSKAITYLEDEDIWEIFHYIDGSFVVYTSTEQMLELTSIGKAIKNNV